MKVHLAAVYLAFGVLLIGCDNRPRDSRTEKAGHPLVGPLRSSTSVIAYRVDKSVDGKGTVNFVVRPEGVGMNPKDQSRLASAVESINFDPVRTSRCIFEPGVEYRFSGEGKAYGLKVCFACDELQFVGDGGVDLSRIVPFSDATKAELLRIAKAVFPNDGEIRALK